jgi:hypothetical protein
MRDAEASHFILFVAMLLFDVLFNGYPVMLQRYNRAVLSRRYSLTPTDGPPRRQHDGSRGGRSS